MKMMSRGVTKGVQYDKDMVGDINFYDNRFRYDYKGFCSIVNQIIDVSILHNKKYNNFNVNINEPQVLKLFNTKFKYNNEEIYDASVFFLEQFFSGQINNTHNAHTIGDINDLKNKKLALDSILEIKKELLDQFKDELFELFQGEPFLGVQIRGTDKVTEINEVPIENIFKHVDSFLNNNKLKKIFLATDDIKYLNLMISRYGKNIVKYNSFNTFSTDSKPLHMVSNRDNINLEVLRDVYFLKNSNFLYYTYSNVGHLALIMGVNQLQGFKNLNELI